jgi:hypothetical protein
MPDFVVDEVKILKIFFPQPNFIWKFAIRAAPKQND